MTFTEAQQDKIVEVVSTNEFTKDDFADSIKPLEESLKEGVLTQEQYDEQIEELAIELYAASLDKIAEEDKLAVEMTGSLTGQETSTLQSSVTEQQEVLEEGSYSYFDILKESSAYGKMLPFVAPNATDPKEQETRMKEWCDKIGGIWRSYVTGSIEDQTLFDENPQVADNIVHGMSFYFTDWLSNGANDKEIKSVVNASAGITNDTGIGGLTNKLFSLFRGLTSFQTQMQRVTAAAGLINRHSNGLSEKDDGKKAKINTMPIFTSPHGFYDWLAHSVSLNPVVPHAAPIPFTEAFEYTITADRDTMKDIMDNLNYDETTHKLMESVLTTGKVVLDKRGQARTMVSEIYDQFAMISEALGGSSVAETLESRGLKGIADFVCLILGFGGLDGMERSHFEKVFNKSFPSKSLPGLQQAVAYAKHYLSDTESVYGPTTHEDRGSVLSQNGLGKAFDMFDYSTHKVGETVLTKDMVLGFVPTSPALLEDGLEHALQSSDGFLPHPVILNQIGMKKYLINDQGGNLIIDPSKKDELKQALNTSKVRTKLISLACHNTLTPDAIVGLAKKNCSPADTIALIYGFLISPLDTVKAVEYNLLDGDTLGNGIEITAMATHGNELTVAKDKEAEESAKKKAIDDAEKAWQDAKIERDNAVIALERAEKGGTDAEKEEAKKAVTKAKAKVEEAKRKLDQVKKDANESDKSADGLGAADDKKEDLPSSDRALTAGLTGAVLDKTFPLSAGNRYTVEIKESIEGLDASKKLGDLTFDEARIFAYAIFGPGPATELLIKLSNNKPALITRLVALGNHEGSLVYDRRNTDPNTASGQINIGTFQVSERPDNIVSIYNNALKTGMEIMTHQGIKYDATYFKTISSYQDLPLNTPQEKAQHDVLTWLGHMKNCGRRESVMKLSEMNDDKDLAELISRKLQVGVDGIGQSVVSQLKQQPLSVYLDKTKDIRSTTPTFSEINPEVPIASIDLPPKSLGQTTKCFGASNAKRIADSLGFDNCNSFQGNTTDQLREEAQKIADWPDNTIIVSTVNNSYQTDADVGKAVDYIKNMIGLCHGNGKRATIVIHPNPDKWFEMAKTPHRFDKFQDYNEKVRNLCLSYPDPKPCVLDFTKQTNLWDSDGYHFSTDRMKDIMKPYIAEEVV